ncbi:hypothetical protein [Rhizobacter sp. OV335]|uniref:hypothetical protein n=1 Tax=Rhizobacter sp. OV335 TaxID=1500264 RepID=UPI001F363CFA|nr:hypothetical protein [Rhizobacter sp. OV335]
MPSWNSCLACSTSATVISAGDRVSGDVSDFAGVFFVNAPCVAARFTVPASVERRGAIEPVFWLLRELLRLTGFGRPASSAFSTCCELARERVGCFGVVGSGMSAGFGSDDVEDLRATLEGAVGIDMAEPSGGVVLAVPERFFPSCY